MFWPFDGLGIFAEDEGSSDGKRPEKGLGDACQRIRLRFRKI